MIRSERVPHALLLLGNAGAGALPLALAYVQRVLCENVSPNEIEACGNCAACVKTEKFVHPDVHFSYPTVGAKMVSTPFLKEWRAAIAENPYMEAFDWLQKLDAENKQGNITTAECLDINRKLSLKIFEGKYKILLMWLPEYLGKEGNRLLKLIEEPPDNTLFVLVAENQDLILNTILSRCQTLRLPSLTDENVAEGLKNDAILGGGLSMTNEAANAIAHLAEGNLNEAWRLAKQKTDDENENAQKFLGWMRHVWKGNGIEMVAFVDEIAKMGREKQKVLFRYGLHFLREVLTYQITQNPNLRLSPNERETALQMQRVMNFEKIELLSELFDDCSHFIERNANPKILFLDASIKMNKILKP